MMYSRSYKLAFLLAMLFLISTSIYFFLPLTKTQRLNKQCQELGKSILRKYQGKGYSGIYEESSTFSYFYSKRLDTCIEKEVDELGIIYRLCDVKRNYLKRTILDNSPCGEIFSCDKDGAAGVILEKVDEHKGIVSELPYSEYRDNGEGVPLRNIKAPTGPYTRERCERLFNQKIKEIE